jgi:hypothetical protein
MPVIVQRCLQCGSPSTCEAERVPPYGARLRCSECGNLLPLVLPPAEAAAREADDLAPEALEGSPAGDARAGDVEAGAPSRAEARRVLDLWIEEVRRTDAPPLVGVGLRDEHREDLERLRRLWTASYPGPESLHLFEEELEKVLKRP